jgi:hypothetical protein
MFKKPQKAETDTNKNHKSQEEIQIKTTRDKNRYRKKPQVRNRYR